MPVILLIWGGKQWIMHAFRVDCLRFKEIHVLALRPWNQGHKLSFPEWKKYVISLTACRVGEHGRLQHDIDIRVHTNSPFSSTCAGISQVMSTIIFHYLAFFGGGGAEGGKGRTTILLLLSWFA